MLTQIIQFFTAPAFEDEEKQRVASLLNVMVNVMLGIALLMTLAFTLSNGVDFWSNPFNSGTIGGLLVSMLVMRFLLRSGYIQFASALLSLALWASTTASIYSSAGVKDSTTGAYLLCIIIAGLLLGGRAAIIFTLFSVVAVLGVWYAGASGVKAYPLETANSFDVVAYGGIFIMGGLLLRYAVNSITEALERAHRNERAQLEANRELEKLRGSLEQQVADRTRDLQRRTNYLEASAQISHAASSILDFDQLLRLVVKSIRERFDLYHVGLFLIDETGHWARYRAGTGPVGRLLEEERFRLEVGGHSMTGRCAESAQPCVAQDVSVETERVTHPLLSETRSEAALPLIARGRVIGALNAQSAQPGVFDPDTVAVLQTMADQVAVAIDNAQLFQQAQESLEAERRAYGQISLEAWTQMLRAGLTPGYRYIDKRVMPIDDEGAARSLGPDSIKPSDSRDEVSLPIQVRGQVIGVVDLRKEAQGSGWTPEETALLQTLTDQLGVALESARLYQDTQRRAAREQMLSRMTADFARSLDIDTILQTAVRELGQTFPAGEISVLVGSPDDAASRANGED
jgi:GAF domain-containing protein